MYISSIYTWKKHMRTKQNRGIMAHSSLTQTTVLKGVFKTDAGVKKEFFDDIKLQQEFAPR
jgi:GTP cyclohydrolase I